jgi:hypothetical protein
MFAGQVSLKFNLFGFECGDGWLGLLDGTLSLIQKKIEENGVEVNLFQVKEKLGLLRIYYRGGDDFTRTAVDIAEIVSGNICELCGRQGEFQNLQGWIQTRCVEHSIDTSSQQNIAFDWERYSVQYSEAVTAIFSMFKSNSVGWIQSPALAFGAKKPYELLSTIDGCEEIIKLINKLEYGVSI